VKAALKQNKLEQIYDDRSSWYDLYHKLGTLNSDERGRKLVVEFGVKEGDSVLDAGGGTGTTSILAARKVGPSGKVTVVDLSRGMLDVAKEKARQAGVLGQMDFIKGDLLKLPFKDHTFDSVLSTYSLCPVYDPVQGALELYRVLKPGGRLAVAHSAVPKGLIWGPVGECFEAIIWHFPTLSLGCRSVDVLPALESAGAKLMKFKSLGLPIMPFHVWLVERPK